MNLFLFQPNGSNLDGVTSPPYPVERSYSPSMHPQRLPDTNIDNLYRRHASPSPPISDMDVYTSSKQRDKSDDGPTATQVIVEKFPLRAQVANFSPTKQQRKVDTISSLSSVQHLVDKTPLAVQTSNYPPTITESPRLVNHSNQWKSLSESSLNQADTRLTPSSSMDIDVPKMNGPSWSHGRPTNAENLYQVDYQPHTEEAYKNTLKTNNKQNYPNNMYTNTHGSLPDTELMYGDTTGSNRSSTNNCKIFI